MQYPYFPMILIIFTRELSWFLKLQFVENFWKYCTHAMYTLPYTYHGWWNCTKLNVNPKTKPISEINAFN